MSEIASQKVLWIANKIYSVSATDCLEQCQSAVYKTSGKNAVYFFFLQDCAVIISILVKWATDIHI